MKSPQLIAIRLTVLLLISTSIIQAQGNDYTFNLDDTVGVVVGNQPQDSLWQIGKPQKTLFDSAFSNSFAIITDTINSYPESSYATFSFRTTIGGPQFQSGALALDLGFMHKYDTDTLKDGGTVLVSSDNQNWTTLQDYTDTYTWHKESWEARGVVESLNGRGFSGNSGSWKYFNYTFWGDGQDSLYVKFVFASDSIDSGKEGWMIDDITLWTNLGVGTQEYKKPQIVISPNPFSDVIRITCDNFIYFELKTLSGNMVMRGKKKTVNINNTPAGAYLISVHTEEGILSKVIVKK